MTADNINVSKKAALRRFMLEEEKANHATPFSCLSSRNNL